MLSPRGLATERHGAPAAIIGAAKGWLRRAVEHRFAKGDAGAGLFDRLRSAGSAQPGGKVAIDAAAEQEALHLIDEGNAIEDEGRLEAALERYDAAVRMAPHLRARARESRQRAIGSGPDQRDAQGLWRSARIDPRYAPAQFNLGNALERSGRRTEALTAYRSALESRPDFAEAGGGGWERLLEDLGHLDPAAAAYRRALRIKPEYAEAHANLGITLRYQGQVSTAVASLRRALEPQARFPGRAQQPRPRVPRSRTLEAAVASFRRALDLKPDLVGAHNNLGLALQDLGRLDEAIASYRRVAELASNSPTAHSNLLFCLSHDESVVPRSAVRRASPFRRDLRGATADRLAPASQCTRPRSPPSGRVRVGPISATTRSPTFIEPVLAHLAQLPSLSLHAYNAHAGGEDCVSRGLRAFVARWDPVATLSDAQLAERVERDGIDILIESSATPEKTACSPLHGSRHPCRSRGSDIREPPAWKRCDYYVADRHFLPAGAFDGQFTEKIVRLPAGSLRSSPMTARRRSTRCLRCAMGT